MSRSSESSATTSQHAAELLMETLGARLIGRPGIPKPDDEQLRRMSLAGAHLFGVALGRHVLQIPPLAGADHDELVAEIAPMIQRYLDGTNRA